MDIEKFVIGLIIMSVASVGIGAFIFDVTARYGTTVDPEFQDQFDNFNQTYALAESISDEVKLGGVEQGDSDSFDIGESIKAGINVVKTVFVQGIPILFTSLTTLGTYTNIPPYIIRSIQAMFLVAISFALVYLYFRYKNG